MQKVPVHFLIVTAVGLAFWECANVILGTQEPWDSPDYLNFYLISLGICAAFGYLFPERPWRWGLIIIFAQLPVMIFHAGHGPLLVMGLAFLTVQAMPAMITATATSYLRKLRHRS